MDDKRYASGTSLTRTYKEEQVDWFDQVLGDMSDELFGGLKRLTSDQLAELTRLVQDCTQRFLDRGRAVKLGVKGPARTVRIEVHGGVVSEVENLPPGWDYEVVDGDE